MIQQDSQWICFECQLPKCTTAEHEEPEEHHSSPEVMSSTASEEDTYIEMDVELPPPSPVGLNTSFTAERSSHPQLLPASEDSAGEEQIPDVLMDDSIVTYKIIEGGNRKGGQLLSDSLGFTYSKKRQSGVAVTWNCRTGKKCPATVRQPLGTTTFTRGPRHHNHPSNPGAELKSTVRAIVKEMARKEMFASSGAIVSRALASIDLEQSGKELPNVNTLLRQANRVRQNLRPNHPVSLDFELDSDNVPSEDIEYEGQRHILSTSQQLDYLAREKV
ncbi:hypothetical protein NL108_004126 [Boleophthalmus pectinirostris]|nr:hypothetical protein NL108_004126 [Boleophthalmus pectinirostris]